MLRYCVTLGTNVCVIMRLVYIESHLIYCIIMNCKKEQKNYDSEANVHSAVRMLVAFLSVMKGRKLYVK